MNVERIAAVIPPLVVVAASCGNSDVTGAVTPSAPATVAPTVATDSFCEAMDHITLLAPEHDRTPPAQVQRTVLDHHGQHTAVGPLAA